MLFRQDDHVLLISQRGKQLLFRTQTHIHAHTHTHTLTHTHTHIHVYIHIYFYACIYMKYICVERYFIIYILKLNQWENTKEVIDWFASIDEKSLYKFVQFDTAEFYPSIKEPLLEKALTFAEAYTDIPTNDKAFIKHASSHSCSTKAKLG